MVEDRQRGRQMTKTERNRMRERGGGEGGREREGGRQREKVSE